MKVLVGPDSTHVEQRDSAGFSRLFGDFYTDRDNKFFIKSEALVQGKDSLEFMSVFIEMPRRLDSATLTRDGDYFIDKSNVICIFGNSDGGGYTPLLGADPASFKAFRNVYGGKDRRHVYYQDRVLEGVNPDNVRVYSDSKSCANCDGYFRDGKILYHDWQRIPDTAYAIPGEYKYVE